MRVVAGVLAVGALVLGLGTPGDANSDGGGRYRHHERYRGDHYDYNEHRGSDPYREAGPYDGYYDCRRSEGPYHSETSCDHYYGWEPEQRS
jgi:hypothetical protein